MLKYILILFSLLFVTPVYANELKRPDVFGIALGSSVDQAENACRRHKGAWLASHLNLFSCKGKGFYVSVEADGKDVVNNIYVTFRQTKSYNEELNSFILKYNSIRSVKRGANNTVINEFNNNEWVGSFMSFGENGNYTAHLYNIKDMLKK